MNTPIDWIPKGHAFGFENLASSQGKVRRRSAAAGDDDLGLLLNPDSAKRGHTTYRD